MSDPQDLAEIAQELEQIEDELRHVSGMEPFRERITEIRMDMVDRGLAEFSDTE